MIINPIIKMYKHIYTMGVLSVIVFNRLWETMKSKGISSYRLREDYDIDTRIIRRLRANMNIETYTLNKLCNILDCRLEDIAEYVRDE